MPIVNPDYVPPIAMTFDEEKPIRSEQGLLLAGNPIAIAQGKPGAPVISQGWHPYDATLNNESDGLLYSHAVDGDVASIETPVLSLNFEYWATWEDVSGGGTNATLNVDLRRASDADYAFATFAAGAINISAAPRQVVGRLGLKTPFLRREYSLDFVSTGGLISSSAQGPSVADMVYYGFFATPDRFDRIRFRPSAGNLTGGKIWLFRRRFEIA
jgi:hypothetical protein